MLRQFAQQCEEFNLGLTPNLKPDMHTPSVIPKRNPLAKRVQSRCSLCWQGLFHNSYSQMFWLVFLPGAGQILRTQNLKSKPQRRAALSSQTAAVARNGLTALAARPLFSMRLAGIFFYDLDGLQLHHPRAVLQLIARMHGRVIRRLVADHGRDDFEPAHSQAA